MATCRSNLLYVSMFVVIFAVGILTIIFVNEEQDSLEHGDRTVPYTYTYPNDPHLNETFPPYGPGQLTLEGQRKMLKLGREIRRRYGDFLGGLYSHDLVEAVSSYYDRCKMSLSLVLATLFPPNADEIIEDGLNWQPVHYTYLLQEDDDMLAFWGKCEDFNSNEIEQYFSSEKIKLLDDEYKEVYEYISLHSGKNITSIFTAAKFYDYFSGQSLYGLELPEWANRVFPEPLRTIHKQHWSGYISSHKGIKYSSGRLLSTIKGSFKKHIDKSLSEERKMHLYAGHDYGLSGILAALRIEHDYTLPTAGYITFELHRLGNAYGVKVFYQDYSQQEPRLMTIQNCSSFCPIDNFTELTKKYYPNPNICE